MKVKFISRIDGSRADRNIKCISAIRTQHSISPLQMANGFPVHAAPRISGRSGAQIVSSLWMDSLHHRSITKTKDPKSVIKFSGVTRGHSLTPASMSEPPRRLLSPSLRTVSIEEWRHAKTQEESFKWGESSLQKISLMVKVFIRFHIHPRYDRHGMMEGFQVDK